MERKSIEDYFDKEWGSLVTAKTLKLLIELTCKKYRLNQPPLPGTYQKSNDGPSPQDLGKI